MGRLGCLVVLVIATSLPQWTGAAAWEDRLELHGRFTSRAYFRSPSLELASNDLQLSSWRNELEIEAYLKLRDSDSLRMDLTAVVRPTYDAVYDLYPDLWGSRPRGGDLGTASADSQRRAQRGRAFPGHGSGIHGEYFLGNQDLAFARSGERRPGISVNPVLVAASGVAPWAAHGPRQPHVGGRASAASFPLQFARGAEQLALSLARAGTEVPGSAPFGLLTPLNRYAGSLGDRDSLDQFPAGLNYSEDRLKYDCFDGPNSTCWLRELYLDVEHEDTFLRLGRQIIAWGKADSFQLQDVINPTDDGLHNIFPSLAERRIPVWAAQVIHTLGDVGPLEDVAVEAVWVLDRFTPRQIGQCGEPYAFTIACQSRLNAATHGALNVSLAEVDERHWTLGNTEPGVRVEFALPNVAMTFSLSAFWGFQDLPVLKARNLYSVGNPNPAAMLLLQAAGAGPFIDAFAKGPGGACPDTNRPWLCGFDPYAHDASGRPSGTLAEANRDLQSVWATQIAPRLAAAPDPLRGWRALESELSALLADQVQPFEATQGLLALPWSGSELVAHYPRVLTLGASMDYDVPGLGAILRAEVAYDVDRGLTNTARPTLEDDSDVLRLVVGVDRPTRLPLPGGPEFFVSVQAFWEHIMDYDNGLGRTDGMVQPRDRLITTMFTSSSFFADRFEFKTLVVTDWTHRAWAIAPTLRWNATDALSFDLGVHILAGRKNEHGFVNLCSDGTADCAGDPGTWVPGQTQTSNLGLRRANEAPFFPESFADRYMEERDEIWFGVTRVF